MRKLLPILFVLLLTTKAYSVPSNSISITPAAVDGAVITASDENSRNNVVSAAYNAHDHTDISQTGNTLNVGDAAAGNKTITAYNADTNKPYLRYDDTNNWWVFSENGVMPSCAIHGNAVIFEGTTDDAFETTLKITDPTADRTITIPNADMNFVTGLPVANGGTGTTTLTDGGILLGSGTGAITALGVATNGQIPIGDGTTDPVLATITGVANETDVTNGAGTITIGIVDPLAISKGGTGATSLTDLITTTALKTATGEVSGPSGMANYTLPGGTYGFYPQIKVLTGGASAVYILANLDPGTTYITNISMGAAGGQTVYAQQRYVTASGEDLWIFLLIDKTTKEIIGAYQAPDHPAYGNGGDFDKLPHPFGSYDKTKHDIILLDKETCLAIKAESEQIGKSILTLVNEEYKPNTEKEEIYQPLHSGRFIDKKHELVQTIPNYIKVRKLNKLTQVEKDTKKIKQEQVRQKTEQEKLKKEQDKISAENKLRALGLTKDEVEAIK